MNRDMQFPQLRAFAAVARLRSYTRAAEELSYTEPAVYLQVRGLEKALGVPLVRRAGQQLVLTPDGDHLLPLVHDLLDRARALDDAARFLHQGPRLTVGAGRHTGVFLLMPVIAAYLAEPEHYEPELHLHDRDGLIHGVLSGDLDLAVAGTLEDHLSLEFRQKHNFVLVPWKSDQWVLTGPPATDLATLQAQDTPVQIFLPAYGISARERLAAGLAPDFAVPPRFTVLGTAEAVKSAVANGLGLALFPILALQSDGADGNLRILRRFGPEGRLPVSILHRHVRMLSTPTRHFLRFVLNARHDDPRPALAPAVAPSHYGLVARIP